MKKINIQDIANYLALRFEMEGIPLTPLKLQKLLYYIQAWHIVFFEKETLFTDLPEAWVNGPVYRKVYENYASRRYKMNDILIQNLSYEDLQSKLKETYTNLGLSTEQDEYLEAVIERYGYISDMQLVNLTHIAQPWNDARRSLGMFDRGTNLISVDAMYNYYHSKRKKVQ